jgi:SAM-dependent methyltransferase
VEFLNHLRAAESQTIAALLRPGARILEVGAGTGRQALDLKARGFDVEAIEIPDSNYKQERLFPITNYDGRHFPFPDASFDIVLSSNVLEHVPDLRALHSEIRRVLRPGGYCLHVLPTHVWRFWTTLTAFPVAFQKVYALGSLLTEPGLSVARKLSRFGLVALKSIGFLLSPFFPNRHGERGVFLSELWLFRPSWWRRNFRANGFDIVTDEPMGLFYTGNFLLGFRISIETRARWARTLGSACHVFKLRPAGATQLP